MDTPEKAHATLKDQQRERDRLMTENLNLKSVFPYIHIRILPPSLPPAAFAQQTYTCTYNSKKGLLRSGCAYRIRVKYLEDLFGEMPAGLPS